MAVAARRFPDDTAGGRGGSVRTTIPARMDRLPWVRWHWMIIAALGITWILDGLEVTIVGAIGSTLTRPDTLRFTDAEVGFTASAYLAGTVVGALVFSYLTDRYGRKKLFMITLLTYLIATILTAFSWNLATFALFRFFTGAGIGGEYSAINSAIDELIPARARGHTDLAINGSWWVGTAVGALITIPLLNPAVIAIDLGWRLCFGLGAVLGLAVLLIRRLVPESPRWLMTHGKLDEAEQVVGSIEHEVESEAGIRELPKVASAIEIHERGPVGFGTVFQQLFTNYPTRAVLGIALMVTQSFLYNAIFFTYALVLTTFYHVPTSNVGLYILPFAVGNFFGPLLLGRFFDTVGRKPMIALTYGLSGVLLAITGYLFWQGVLDALTQTIAWSIIFFFASAGASSAYLTVSEVFPLEIRAMAIALFFAIGQGAGIVAPWLFGKLIEKSAFSVFVGDLVGAGFMIIGALVALAFAVQAERRSLEDIAAPLSVAPAPRLVPST